MLINLLIALVSGIAGVVTGLLLALNPAPADAPGALMVPEASLAASPPAEAPEVEESEAPAASEEPTNEVCLAAAPTAPRQLPEVRLEPLARAALVAPPSRAAADPDAEDPPAPVLAPAPRLADQEAPAGTRHLALEVASFAERASAEALVSELATDGLEAAVARTEASGREWFVVTLGRFADRAAARRQAQALEARLGRRLRTVLVLPLEPEEAQNQPPA